MHDDEEWRKLFSQLKEVPFPDNLKHTILDRAQALHSKRRPYQWVRSLATTIAGVAAAGMLVVGAWHYGGQSPMPRLAHRISTTSPADNNSGYGLNVAPISVGFIVQDPQSSTTGVLQATLTNVGTTALKPSDVVGVLSFQQGGQPDTLIGADWATFVDPPNQPIDPGQTLTWTFRPIGVPTTSGRKFLGDPKLIFLEKGFVDAAKADFVWQKAPMKVTDVTTMPRSSWPEGKSFRVTATVTNVTSVPLKLNDAIALIWFSNQDRTDDWTQPGIVRFMHQLTLSHAPVLLAPGESTTVHFDLIGPSTLDVSTSHVNVSLIWR